MSEEAPSGIDTSRPSIARSYDYFLGGKDNYAVDREMAEAALRIAPEGRGSALTNRAFLRRAVRHLAAEAGVDQFLDLGSGLPTQGNVHEVAQAVNPAARVVYVDNDPIVLAHGRALLTHNDTTRVLQADVRDPEGILARAKDFLDFTRPVGLLLFGILHHLDDDEDPAGVLAVLRGTLAPGSHVAISHFHDPGDAHPEASRVAREGEKVFNATLGTGRWRTREEILAFVDGLEVLEPGLVPLAEWRPDPGDPILEQGATYHAFAGIVARKPL
ncbi:SAM-dependent methyltransferase [Actinomadura hibisca]|uniref:SAM-dependent methyltransferase n=1 Tax=Actinomadura hibisca TaxID=68565 RepID=UPI00082A8AC5|nr:SAM-dependent methyltransferase [Actinomadura hibisca]